MYAPPPPYSIRGTRQGVREGPGSTGRKRDAAGTSRKRDAAGTGPGTGRGRDGRERDGAGDGTGPPPVVPGTGRHPRHAERAWRDVVGLLAECLTLAE